MGQHELVHLSRMLEQIAANFCWESDQERAAAAVAAHIKRFWSPDLRAQVVAAATSGSISPGPVARAAIRQLD
ncbi:MAG: formate dehydrogenase subunit delta [Pseudomonadales bacterium]|jgi:hypothetical protein|nr:formate dehydrogenase subunit delta [Gammaproteobacteria bacterium]MBP6050563.1 formate dehydrogenase subunit delta [Pseudomonadales bacterium]MBK6583411.1 formate dehydrogenase subunit delta [Gammaproteobacteria bacterium]MBK7168967.1 formate dehydrogenase subunit delta [Gammaproteobacteria bacterium]MBK7521126.1 formate dehydrogenase subunit delta [Gammaproteobacteria bacterium]